MGAGEPDTVPSIPKEKGKIWIEWVTMDTRQNSWREKEKVTFRCLWDDKSDTSYSSWGAILQFLFSVSSLNLPHLLVFSPWETAFQLLSRLSGQYTSPQARALLPWGTSGFLPQRSLLHVTSPCALLTSESCLVCFNVSASFHHRGEGGEHSKRNPGQSVWWAVGAP